MASVCQVIARSPLYGSSVFRCLLFVQVCRYKYDSAPYYPVENCSRIGIEVAPAPPIVVIIDPSLRGLAVKRWTP